MTAGGWIVDALGAETVRRASEEAGRRRLREALGLDTRDGLDDDRLRFVASTLELRVVVLLDGENRDDLRAAAADAFQIARVLPRAAEPLEAAEHLVRLGCLGVLGDRGADVKRLLSNGGLPALPVAADDWGRRVWATTLDVWLRLFRKHGWRPCSLHVIQFFTDCCSHRSGHFLWGEQSM